MPVLVDYRCTGCRHDNERWATHPIDLTVDCARCGSPARRRYSAAALIGSSVPPASSASTSCADHAGVPGSCSLTGPAARMLAARASGDNRRIDTELSRQETAVADGSLNPRAPIIAASPAHHAG